MSIPKTNIDEKIKNSREGHRKRLQERYLNGGYKALADYEIVEFLLFLVIPRKDTKALAKELLERFSSINGIFEANLEELRSIKGLGDVSSTYIKFLGDMYSSVSYTHLTLPTIRLV